MDDEQAFLSGESPWWRYSAYAIRGDHIVPAPGATLETYSPWKELKDGYGRRAGYSPAYIELSKHAELWRRERDREALYAAVLGWCNQHGLLGTLPHELREVWLAPRWLEGEWSNLDPQDATLRPMSKHYSWGPDGWIEGKDAVTVSRDVLETLGKVRHGAILDPETVKRIRDRDPNSPIPPDGVGAYLQEYGPSRFRGSPTTRHVPLVGEWSGQFCVVGDPYAFDYPPPASRLFWRTYREPVEHFRWYAGRIVDALTGLGMADAKRNATAVTTLNQLMHSVRIRLVREEGGKLRQAWVTPSLIATLAVMAVADATGGRHIGQCEFCGALFVTNRPHRRFCSPKHQDNAKKRRSRGSNS